MSAISKLISPTTTQESLRPFDSRRDLPAVADLVETCFADTLDESGREYLTRMRSAAKSSSWMPWGGLAAGLNGAPLAGYVWQEDGRVVGNASLIPYFNQGHWFYLIANVAVLPEYRRRGIARQLTKKCVEHARQRRTPSVWLHVRQDNDGAKTLYESLGFVARACRTTWWNPMSHNSPRPLPGITLASLRGRDWEAQRQWLQQTYPSEITWHMPYHASALRPDLWGGFIRFLYDAYILQWGVFQDGRLLAALTWQSAPGPANHFWLAAPAYLDENMLHALLLHAIHRLPAQRPVVLDYPAGQFDQALQSAGFSAQQTLIWMELKLS